MPRGVGRVTSVRDSPLEDVGAGPGEHRFQQAAQQPSATERDPEQAGGVAVASLPEQDGRDDGYGYGDVDRAQSGELDSRGVEPGGRARVEPEKDALVEALRRSFRHQGRSPHEEQEGERDDDEAE